MKRFIDAGRQAIAEKNWYAALSLALTIPDICGSLEDPGPGRTRKRYVGWCEKWLVPKFTHSVGGKIRVFLSSSDCYQIRNSLIHSGSSEIIETNVEILHRIEFFETGSHLNLVEGNTVNGVRQPNFLQMRVDRFSEAMFEAADEWDEASKGVPEIQAEKRKLLVIHPPGTVIGGVQFA